LKGLCDGEGFLWARANQLVERGLQELGRVAKPQAAEAEEDVLLYIVWDAGYLALLLADGLHDEVGIISPQIVEDHRDMRLYRTQSEFQVAAVVGSTPVLTP
jgi:hypothetical protein